MFIIVNICQTVDIHIRKSSRKCLDTPCYRLYVKTMQENKNDETCNDKTMSLVMPIPHPLSINAIQFDMTQFRSMKQRL